jgi:hypothetical protein
MRELNLKELNVVSAAGIKDDQLEPYHAAIYTSVSAAITLWPLTLIGLSSLGMLGIPAAAGALAAVTIPSGAIAYGVAHQVDKHKG